MIDKFYKYAELLLKRGLCMYKGQPLVVQAPISEIEFVRVLTEVASKMGVEDIYFDWYDDKLKYIELSNFSDEGLLNSRLFNKEIHDVYAKKDAAFLFLVASGEDLFKDVSCDRMKMVAKKSLESRSLYRKLQGDNKISWCIAGVSSSEWAKLLFPNDSLGYEKLWNLIFDICFIESDNPIDEWDNLIKNNHNLCDKLTKLNIKSMHYSNSLGTDLTVELANNAKWCGGSSMINDRELLVNLPSFEVFTTPNKYKTNGVIYSSIPLVHSGIVIKDIKLEFIDGKVVSYDASCGKSELENIINYDNESNMLGEVALVDKDTKIAKSRVLFYETLFDENASCHIALGCGFKECLDGSFNIDNDELDKIGYNSSKNHVDLMVGTDDLCIDAITYDGTEIRIFENGKFII